MNIATVNPVTENRLSVRDVTLKNLHRGILLLVLILIAWQPATLRANGWEHWGIPLQVLLDTLQGDDQNYQVRAARSLAIRGESAAVEPLLEVLNREQQPVWVQVAMIDALGRIGDGRAMQTLHKRLADDSREEIRSAAATALGRMADARSIVPLKKALADPSLLVRSASVSSMGSFNDSAVVALLGELLKLQGLSRSLRPRVIRSLGQTRSTDAVDILLTELDNADGNERAQLMVLDALALIADSEMVSSLQALVASTNSIAVRLRAVIAIASTSQEGATPLLTDMLKDDAAAVRFHAVTGLRKIANRNTVAEIAALYGRETSAANGLLTMPVSESTTATKLFANAGDTRRYLAHQSLRIEAIRAIAAIEPSAATDALLDAAKRTTYNRDNALGLRLNEGAYTLRRTAIAALGYADSETVTDNLLATAIDDPDFRIRSTAVRALGVLGHSQSREALVTAMNDSKPDVRWIAATVLGRLPAFDPFTVLTKGLDDQHPEVRRQSVLSLGYLGAADSRERIEALSKSDGDERVRQAAATTLSILPTN